MMTPPLSIWARPFLVAQVDVSTVIDRDPFVIRARIAGRVWPRGRRPLESAEPLARRDYGTSASWTRARARFASAQGPSEWDAAGRPSVTARSCRITDTTGNEAMPRSARHLTERDRSRSWTDSRGEPKGDAMRKLMVLPLAGPAGVAHESVRAMGGTAGPWGGGAGRGRSERVEHERRR